jgi:hypothetical protein
LRREDRLPGLRIEHPDLLPQAGGVLTPAGVLGLVGAHGPSGYLTCGFPLSHPLLRGFHLLTRSDQALVELADASRSAGTGAAGLNLAELLDPGHLCASFRCQHEEVGFLLGLRG